MNEGSQLMREYETATEMRSATVESRNQQSARNDHSGRNVYVAPRLGSSRRARRNEWSSADVRQLRELAATGTPLAAIAAALCRTKSAVRNKAGMHGISLRFTAPSRR